MTLYDDRPIIHCNIVILPSYRFCMACELSLWNKFVLLSVVSYRNSLVSYIVLIMTYAHIMVLYPRTKYLTLIHIHNYFITKRSNFVILCHDSDIFQHYGLLYRESHLDNVVLY